MYLYYVLANVRVVYTGYVGGGVGQQPRQGQII